MRVISSFLVSNLSSQANESPSRQKQRKKEREKSYLNISSLWSAELSQHSCHSQKRWRCLKNPFWERWRDDGCLLPNSIPSLVIPPRPSPTPPIVLSLAAKQAASHWSCKLCLRCVYAPFLPKHLLSLTNYIRINYKPFRETDSHRAPAERETCRHTHERSRHRVRGEEGTERASKETKWCWSNTSNIL